MSAIMQSAFAVCIDSRVPWDQYRALHGLSITTLKELRRSPLHYYFRRHTPKDTQPLTLGRAAHCAVLEPERFEREHAIWNRRTKSGKLGPRSGKWWKAFCDESAGRSIINEDELHGVTAIQSAVRGNADAMVYLESGDPEVTLQWATWERQCKGRADWLTHIDGAPVIVGLKTARDARLFPFSSAAARLGYHLQWAFYFDGFRAITGKRARMIEIVVESDEPHDVVVYRIPEEVIDQGRDEYIALLEQLAKCEESGVWPGSACGEQLFSLPSWAYESNDDLTEIGLEF